MKKRMLCLLVCLTLIFALAVPGMAANYEAQAQALKDVGLFQGTDKGFELDRAATRVEAGVMLVRLLGMEQKALDEYEAGTTSHPFTDVPAWADAYVAYLYTNKLTNGVSETSFGTGECTAQMYCTFVLRALGYSEAEGDFTYAAALDKATELGLYSSLYLGGDFMRDQVAAISYQALATNVKGTETTLLAKLMNDGVVTGEAAEKLAARQETYREYLAIAAGAEASQAVAMTAATTVTMKAGETTLTTTGNMNIAVIANGDDIQLAMDGTTKVGEEEVAIKEWVKDGYLYMDIAGQQTKVKMDLSEIEQLVAQSTGDVTAAADPFYMISDIVKNADGSYTITYGNALTGAVDTVLGQLELPGVPQIAITSSKCTVAFDTNGRIKDMTVDMAMTVTVTDENNQTVTCEVTTNVVSHVNAWGETVKINFPEFSAFVEVDANGQPVTETPAEGTETETPAEGTETETPAEGTETETPAA